jgi:hypothetical protein
MINKMTDKGSSKTLDARDTRLYCYYQIKGQAGTVEKDRFQGAAAQETGLAL